MNVKEDIGDARVPDSREDDASDAEIRGASSLLKMRESGRNENLRNPDTGMAAEETAVADNLSSCDGNFIQEAVYNGVEEKDEDLNEDEDVPDDKIVTINVPIADMSENKDVEEDNMDEVGFEFSVGDFVWGKIKSHPWWPGLIYDPSDASEYAVKLKHKNRLLVAYFGDGTFAWCHPSQLMPFEENFEEMSKQSSSKSFLNAVQNAVDEIGRLAEVKISCSCLPEQGMVPLSWPFAENAGIKEGVLVPGGGIEKFLTVLPEPTEFLTELKIVAKTPSFTSLLGLRIIEGQLAAFYRSRGFYPLPIYHESRPIPGLEDDLEFRSVDTGKFNSTANNPMQGPSEEDWLPSTIGIKFGETDKLVLHNCQGMPGNRLPHRRKQKSIAEIMDADTENKEGGTDTDVMDKLVQFSGRGRKRKRDDENVSQYMDLNSIDEKVRKTKECGSPSSTIVNDYRAKSNGCESKEKGEKRPLARGGERKELVNSGSDGVGGNQDVKETEMLNDGCRISGGLTNEQNEKSCLSRERKKSKYLSPPFTNLSRGKMKRDRENSKDSDLAEGMTKTAGLCTDSPPFLKSTPDINLAKLSEELDLERDKLENLDRQIPKPDENKSIDPMKVGASAEEVLVGVRYAAVDPLYPLQTKHFETVVSFMGALRSCIYHHGSYYKMYNKHRPGRTRKNQRPEQALQSMDQTPTAISVTDKQKIKKKKYTKNNMPDELQSSGTPEKKAERSEIKITEQGSDKKVGAKETKERDSPAALFVTFGPGSSLPSRADLIKIYSKFGALNEMETDVFFRNFCARVMFLRSSDAEEAFSHSQIVRPFGDTNVKFLLRYSSLASETRGTNELSQVEVSHLSTSMGKTLEKSPAMQPSVAEASQLQFIRQKLEAMSSMLENSNGKVSPDLKSKLQSEMKGLLEEVSAMVRSTNSPN